MMNKVIMPAFVNDKQAMSNLADFLGDELIGIMEMYDGEYDTDEQSLAYFNMVIELVSTIAGRTHQS